MRLAIFILNLTLVTTVYAQECSEQMVFWSSTNAIQWPDFQGSPDSSFQTFDGRIAKAVSAVGIRFLSVDSIDYYSECYILKSTFYCSESWHTGTSDSLLNHERRHFDLLEIQTRKLRKRLLSLTADCNEGVVINDELQPILVQFNSINSLYDQQTVFGTNIMNQSLWDEKIRQELLELGEYTDDTVICLCED